MNLLPRFTLGSTPPKRKLRNGSGKKSRSPSDSPGLRRFDRQDLERLMVGYQAGELLAFYSADAVASSSRRTTRLPA
jgi:hypothetical protein